MTAATPIILCADDYGLSPGVSQGIRELAEAGHLSATSCMTGSPYWAEEAIRLKPLRDRLAVGLHLTLTDQQPLGPMADLAPEGRLPSNGALIKRSMLRRLNAAEIRAELERQIGAFEQHFGAPPDFIDGHQHVHQLPVIRDVVVAVMRERLPAAWLRVCVEPLDVILRRGVDPLRAAVISLLGLRLRVLARRHGIAHNSRFAGVYDITQPAPYASLMARFLGNATDDTLIMCHPGHADEALQAADPGYVQREPELAFLRSAAFAALLERHGATLVKAPA